jgi:hypothetical protein
MIGLLPGTKVRRAAGTTDIRSGLPWRQGRERPEVALEIHH